MPSALQTSSTYTVIFFTPMFDRGYTGHEYLDEFDIINMNGRLYNPTLGRFLSPDPYVADNTYSQDFNRYSYCRNNPMMYTDPSGEYVHLIIGAAIGGIINVAVNWKNINGDFWKGLGYFGIGAFAGALGAGVGTGVSAALVASQTTFSTGAAFVAGFLGSSNAVLSSGFCAGFISGAAGGFTAGFINGAGNEIAGGGGNINDVMEEGFRGAAIGALFGGIAGGITGGIDAYKSGRNFWTGAGKQSMVTNGTASITSKAYESAKIGSPTYEKYTIKFPETTEPYSMKIPIPKDINGLYPTGIVGDVNFTSILENNVLTISFPEGVPANTSTYILGWRWHHNSYITASSRQIFNNFTIKNLFFAGANYSYYFK